eukprot:692491-Pleurochrysis_carterae.AAC.1
MAIEVDTRGRVRANPNKKRFVPEHFRSRRFKTFIFALVIPALVNSKIAPPLELVSETGLRPPPRAELSCAQFTPSPTHHHGPVLKLSSFASHRH